MASNPLTAGLGKMLLGAPHVSLGAASAARLSVETYGTTSTTTPIPANPNAVITPVINANRLVSSRFCVA